MLKRKLMTSLLVTVMTAMSLAPCVMADETDITEEVTEEAVAEESETEDTEETEIEEIEVEEPDVIVTEPEVVEDEEIIEETEAEEAEIDGEEASEMTFEEVEDAEEIEVEEDIVILDSDIDNDQLAEQYIMQEMTPGYQAYYAYDYQSELNEVEATIYNGILPEVQSVAAGNISNTILSMSLNVTYTAEELGLETVDVETTVISEALKSKFSGRMVVVALMSSCPYELYWFDKTAGAKPTYGLKKNTEENTVTVTTYKIKFAVATEYQDVTAPEADRKYTYDTSYGEAAAAAAENARAIIAACAGLSDYAKLEAYKNKICELTDYNNEAIADDWPYGNPWQLVWVFDGDPDTKVVCEGYSKAFQFLCDNSAFQSPEIYCISIDGRANLNTGLKSPHMWNLVHMEDGKNYLVDVTNSDGTGLDLFLIGADWNKTVEGYIIFNGYRYYYSNDVNNFFDSAALTLPSYHYVPQGTGITGWWKKGNTWYYFNQDGTLKTGWLKDGNKWYYMNSRGEMQTGWVKSSGKWYYMTAGGAMKTGWLKDAGKWYYLKSSGEMAIGWLKVGKEWYYFNSDGKMRVGWLKYNGKWYCLHTDGHMLRDSTWKINGKYYHFDKNGVCTNP